jgi:hypothetical protein
MTSLSMQLLNQLQQEENPTRRALICKAMDEIASGRLDEAERIIITLQGKTIIVKELYPDTIDIKPSKTDPSMLRGIPRVLTKG